MIRDYLRITLSESKPLTKEKIDEIESSPSTKPLFINLKSIPIEQEFKNTAQLLNRFSECSLWAEIDVKLSKKKQDFHILSYLSNLTRLSLRWNWNPESLEFLSELSNLKDLDIANPPSKTLSLAPISRLQKLESLEVEKLTSNFESLNKCTSLKHLGIDKISNIDINKIFRDTNLLELSTGDCGENIFESIKNLPIRIFRGCINKSIQDLSFLSCCSQLIGINIVEAKGLKSLNGIESAKKLTCFFLQDVPNLKDWSAIRKCSNLETIYSEKLADKSALSSLEKHPSLKYGTLAVNMGKEPKALPLEKTNLQEYWKKMEERIWAHGA